jgi:hypothetical protein
MKPHSPVQSAQLGAVRRDAWVQGIVEWNGLGRNAVVEWNGLGRNAVVHEI